MRILFINLFGTVFLVVVPGQLSRRLIALRDWASERHQSSQSS
jgi:hypothetical protein